MIPVGDGEPVQLGERLVTVPPGLIAREVPAPGPLEDRDDLGDLVRRRVGGRVQRGEALAVRRRGVLERVQHRQRLLVARDVRGLLAGLLLLAPDAQHVVVELEREPQGPAEAAVPGDDGLVVGGQQGAGLDRGRDQGRGLAADHVEVQLHGHRLVGGRGGDVEVLALAQQHARLVVQPHQAQHLGVAEAEVGQPVERDPRQAEDEVAGVDRLRHAVERPQRRPVAALDVAVLDVVVDEAEVVAQLHRRGPRQGRPVVARDRRVGEQAQQRPHALAARAVGAVEAKVVADHRVHAGRGRLAILHDPEDLRLRVGEQDGQVEVAADGHRLPV